MKTIEEYVEYLFHCDYFADDFDPSGHSDHLKTANEFFDAYDWKEIYPVLYRRLLTQCPTSEDVINFVNLYFYYGASVWKIPNPVEFVSYLYFKVDMYQDRYWDIAGDLFDSFTIEMFSAHGLADIVEDPYYDPLQDERILNGIARWKEKMRSERTN